MPHPVPHAGQLPHDVSHTVPYPGQAPHRLGNHTVDAPVGTYRNGYGTAFSCTATCFFITGTYVVGVFCFLLLLFWIPVQTPSKEDKSSALFWADSNEDAPHDVPTTKTTTSSWFARLFSPRRAEHDNMSARLLGREPQDEDWYYQESSKPKRRTTYKSISVGTDVDPPDQQSQPSTWLGRGETYMIVTDTETLFDALPPRSSPKATSIFGSTSPKKASPTARLSPIVANTTSELLPSDSSSFFVSNLTPTSLPAAPPASPKSPRSPRSPRSPARAERMNTDVVATALLEPSAAESNVLMVRSIERRASIQHRAEKRKETAKADISYENLRDEEIHMYEYLEFIHELLEGITIRKICQQSGKIVKRVFYINKQMTTVYWHTLASKRWINKKSSLSTRLIAKVLKGYTPRKATSRPLDKQNLYVSIECSDGKHLALEATDEALRQRFYLGFSRLAQEKRQEATNATLPSEGVRLAPLRPSPLELLEEDEEKESDVRVDPEEHSS